MIRMINQWYGSNGFLFPFHFLLHQKFWIKLLLLLPFLILLMPYINNFEIFDQSFPLFYYFHWIIAMICPILLLSAEHKDKVRFINFELSLNCFHRLQEAGGKLKQKGSKDSKALLPLLLPLKKSASHYFCFCFCFHITAIYKTDPLSGS